VIADLVAVAAYVAAALLLAAGVVKVARPLPTARAMYAAGLPGSISVARAVGAAEVAVAGWFLLDPSLGSGLALGAVYLAFAGFVGFLVVARPGASSCGCAGATEVPPSPIHAVLNLAAAAAGVAAALAPPASLAHALVDLGWVGVPYAVGLAAAGVLAVAAVTDLPGAMTAYRRPAGHPVEADRDRHARADEALASAGVGRSHPSLWPGVDPEILAGGAATEPADG
jgi:hypothetical protein